MLAPKCKVDLRQKANRAFEIGRPLTVPRLILVFATILTSTLVCSIGVSADLLQTITPFLPMPHTMKGHHTKERQERQRDPSVQKHGDGDA